MTPNALFSYSFFLCLTLWNVSSLVSASPFKPGDQAPEFTLTSLDKKQISLKSLRAKGHVILVFWET